MATLHEGFSSAEFDPVATAFRGFRAFLIDDYDPQAPRYTHATLKERLQGLDRSRGLVAGGRRLKGALRGIFMTDYYWGPDVNEAVCMRGKAPWGPEYRNHPAGLIKAECDCGFWAYTNGDHYLSVGGPAALGVVEGWGRMVVGPHGFRAERARIVALTFPTLPEPQTEDTSPSSSSQASVTRQTPLGAMNAALTMWAHSITVTLAKVNGDPPPPPPVEVNRAARPWEVVPDDLRQAVRRLYPHTQVFDTVAEMQAAFPLTDTRGLLPPPEAA